ncbi:Fe2+-enterobactin ABC transporter substrate-binding protein [Leucobacter allii]|uniref:Fe2+-enterobactin ABC transporter substrate-binding protein n=1 Tax=Leucobacter allii TaxID=2932247 RepID=A0ABY4FIA9_9MICO|nr:Fe2+-enterobactin ABC transporter substrate-binding protein [Leucobacter allii]UOQ55831.1 Fe2+-enterobactin ABC transporter substrate-binding protein [Leucobacter allii]
MHTTLRALTAAGAVALLALTGCSSSGGADAETGGETPASAEGWPRTIVHDAGETEIPDEPLTIVSTSVTLTGSLLAIDAPVAASAATGVGPITDDQGFFRQWADVADERGVEVLYPDLTLDLEAVELAEPDLIVGSSIGADATAEAYDQLSEIAPTIMIDYGTHDWREILGQLGEATGHEAEAGRTLDDFDAWVAEQAADLEPVAGPVTALSYNGADPSMIFEPNSSQAELLTALGFEYAGAPDEVVAEHRSDASSVTPENLPTALGDKSALFMVSIERDGVDGVTSDPLLANARAVADDTVVPLGATSFRIDPYSARLLVEAVVEAFGSSR